MCIFCLWTTTIFLCSRLWIRFGSVVGCSARYKASSMPPEELESDSEVTQSCLILCDPMDCTVHGILQARILEGVAFPFSKWFSQLRERTQLSCIAGGFFNSWATSEAQRKLEWIACPFSSGSYRSRSQTGVSCIAGRFFTNWAKPSGKLSFTFVCTIESMGLSIRSPWGLAPIYLPSTSFLHSLPLKSSWQQQ